MNNFSNGVLRVKRYGSTGAAHSFGSDLNLTADRVKLPVKTGRFTSQRDNLVYFNAAESVGIGTTIGAAINEVKVQVGVTTELVSFLQIHISSKPPLQDWSETYFYKNNNSRCKFSDCW